MINRFKYAYPLLVIIFALLAGSLACKTGTEVPPPINLPVDVVEEMERADGEDPEGRGDWFLFQRLYPFNTLPEEARLRAWEARPRARGEIAPYAAVATWQAIGPAPTTSAYMPNWGFTSGRINSIAVSPSDSQIILVGSATGGIWRSTNGGNSFAPVSDDHVDLAVGSIAFSRSNPSIVYAGMGDTRSGYLGSGVLKSTNAGSTWRRVSNGSLPTPGTIARIEVDPNNSNRIYLAQYTRLAVDRALSSGFYLSTDGGSNWSRRLTGLARDLAINPADPRTLYLGMSRVDEPVGAPAGLYRSSDAGMSWSVVYTIPYDPARTRDVRVSLSQAGSPTVYVYAGGTLDGAFELKVEASTDGGTTWTHKGGAGLDTAQFGYNTYIVADPNNQGIVYVGSRDLYKSTDGGANWANLTRNFSDNGESFRYTPTASSSHPDQHAFTFLPGSSDQILIGNDGGLSKSTDAGSTFRSLNGTLRLTQFTSIAVHPTNPAITYGGSQDNGTQRRVNGSSDWREFISGDGGRVIIDPVDPGIVYTTYIRGSIYRFSNDGRTYEKQIGSNGTFGEPESNGRIAFYPPFTGNGVDSTLYFGTWRLFTSTNGGDGWSAPAGELDLTRGITPNGRDVLSAIGVARGNTSVIYTGSAQGRAMVSTDGGGTWRDITAGLPNRFIKSITVDPINAQSAYLTVSGFGTTHVFRTPDEGSTWIDISGNLPDIPVNDLLIDPFNPSVLYVGTDIGVFRSITGGNNWDSFVDGLPPVIINEIAASATGLMQVATYGRGAYELMLDNPGAALPTISSASFDGAKQVSISGTRFGPSPVVLINNADRSAYIKSSSDTLIKLKAKAKKLGLKSGDNTVQVTGPGGISNIFVIRL